MKTLNVDVAIIGAGTAGLNARREVEKANKSYVLIEEGQHGTTCARVGCMPSKLLIAAADAAHHARSAGVFGVEVPSVGVDGESVMHRIRSERDRFVSYVLRTIDGLEPEAKLHGHARFVGANTLRVHDVEVNFDTCVVATGSNAFIPPQLSGVAEHVLLNDDVFEWDDLPASIAIFGTGVIGLEIGQALHRLGVDVQFFNPYEQLGFLQDPEIAAVARDALGAELKLSLGVETERVERRGGQFVVRWSDDDGEHERTFEHVLAAAGRRPNLAGLDLEVTGIELDDRGHPTNWDPHTTRIGETSLFLAGDVTGHRPILHEASDEGRIAGHNAVLFPDTQFSRRREPIGIAFTSPNMAFVGRRFKALDPDDHVIGEVSFENQGRSRVMDVATGKLRLYANHNCELVGAELFAPRGEHLAHLLAWSLSARVSVQQLLAMPYYHPTIEEGLRTAVRDLAKELTIVGQCPPQDLSFGPGS